MSAALAALAAVVALAALRPRGHMLLCLAFLAACAVTWRQLGGSAAVVECASVGAGVLALRRRLLALGSSPPNARPARPRDAGSGTTFT